MTKKIIIALIGMAALYGCKPKDPCDSEVKSDVDKYLLQDGFWFEVSDAEGKPLLYTSYQSNDIKMYDENWQPIPLDFYKTSNIGKPFFSVLSIHFLKHPLLGLGEEFQSKTYIKFKEDIDTLQIWANIKKLTCNKTYTDRLQVQQNDLPVQNLILNNGEVKYNVRQPYNRGIQIIK
jgi:hypothetical protein